MTLCVMEYCFHKTKNFSGILKRLHFGVKESFGLALLVPLTLL